VIIDFEVIVIRLITYTTSKTINLKIILTIRIILNVDLRE